MSVGAGERCGYCGSTNDVKWTGADYPQCIDCRIERGQEPRPEDWVHPADTKPTDKTIVTLREQLAAVEHERWSEWQQHVHNQSTRNNDGSLTIPAELVERWERQINTSYEELSEPEKESDRQQVDRYLPLITPLITKQQLGTVVVEEITPEIERKAHEKFRAAASDHF